MLYPHQRFNLIKLRLSFIEVVKSGCLFMKTNRKVSHSRCALSILRCVAQYRCLFGGGDIYQINLRVTAQRDLSYIQLSSPPPA